MRLIVLIDEDEMDKMPADCHECILWEEMAGEEYCVGMGHQRIYDEELLNGRPDWCPLKPLPEKGLTWFDDERDDYALGWNACLDAITGGKV